MVALSLCSKTKAPGGLPGASLSSRDGARDAGGSVRRADVRCLRTLRAGADVERDALAFLQRLEAPFLDRREMREKILATVFRRDEAETLGFVEPLHSACC